MALRSLAVKMRIPASAARRLLSPAHVWPASGSRAFTFSSSSYRYCPTKSTRERYLVELERYEDATTQLERFRLEVLWAERFHKLITWTYRLVVPCSIGATALRAAGFGPEPVKDSLCQCMCTRCKNCVYRDFP